MLLKINSLTPRHHFPSYDPNFNIARNDQYRDKSIIFQGDGMESPRPFTSISWTIFILATSSIDKSQLVHPSLPRASALSFMSCSSDPVKQTNNNTKNKNRNNEKKRSFKKRKARTGGEEKKTDDKKGQRRRKTGSKAFMNSFLLTKFLQWESFVGWINNIPHWVQKDAGRKQDWLETNTNYISLFSLWLLICFVSMKKAYPAMKHLGNIHNQKFQKKDNASRTTT